MEPVAVIGKLLFPAPACIDRGPELPDLRSLACETERAERSIDIVCLRADRTVIYAINDLDFVPSEKRCADRVAEIAPDDHAECSKKELENLSRAPSSPSGEQ